MASLAYKKALKISDIDKKYLFGIAVTASLKSNYNKLGEHRFHIALQNEKQTVSSIVFLKKISDLVKKKKIYYQHLY